MVWDVVEADIPLRAHVQSPTQLRKAGMAARRNWKEEENTKAIHHKWASSHAESRRLRTVKLRRERAPNDGADPPDPPPSRQYCCTRRCSEAFPPSVVATLRAAHNRLAPGDQRHFYKARIHIQTM